MKLSDLSLRKRLRLLSATLIVLLIAMAVIVWLRSVSLRRETSRYAIFDEVLQEVTNLHKATQGYVYLEKHADAQEQTVRAAATELRKATQRMLEMKQKTSLAQDAMRINSQIDSLQTLTESLEAARRVYAQRNEDLIQSQLKVIKSLPGVNKVQNEKSRRLIESGFRNIYLHHATGMLTRSWITQGIADYRAATENIKATGEDTFALSMLQECLTRFDAVSTALSNVQACEREAEKIFYSVTENLTLLSSQRMEVLVRGHQHNATIMLCIELLIILILVLMLEHLLHDWGRGIDEMSEGLNRMYEGDLSQADDVYRRFEGRKDELGYLMRATIGLNDKLRDVVQEIGKHSVMINNTSEQMSQLAGTLSADANAQASSAEEASSAIEQLSAGVDMNSENSIMSCEKVQKGLGGLQEIKKVFGTAITNATSVGERIDVISDIVSQTNILALNAAVEAARAGESGRGFAVVAAEVRKLAERSNAAAQEIVGLVDDLMHSAQKAGDSFNAQLPEIEKTAELAQNVANTSSEQRNGMQQMNLAIQQLSEMSQRVANSSNQLTETANNLVQSGNALKRAASYFRLSA